MSRKKRAGVSIFVDLDGPILDVSLRQYLIYQRILTQAGFPPVSRNTYWNLKRNKVSPAELLDFSSARSFAGKYRRRWLALIEKQSALLWDRPWPGVSGILTRLKQRYPLILVTLRFSRANLYRQLSRLGLRRFFAEVLAGADNQGDWRTKYRLIKTSPYFSPGSWIIGDTEVDIIAGKKLEISTVAVLSGIRNRKALCKYKPDYISRDLAGAASIIFQADSSL